MSRAYQRTVRLTAGDAPSNLTRHLGIHGHHRQLHTTRPIDIDMNPADSDFADAITPHTALGRYGSVDEVADLVAFVASPKSSYLTGTCLNVDGGVNA